MQEDKESFQGLRFEKSKSSSHVEMSFIPLKSLQYHFSHPENEVDLRKEEQIIVWINLMLLWAPAAVKVSFAAQEAGVVVPQVEVVGSDPTIHNLR